LPEVAVKYNLKIENALESSGTVDFHRLARLAEGLRRISEGALQIRLQGISKAKGRKKTSLHHALKVTLTGISKGSTVLDLETRTFGETLSDFQTDLFRAEIQQELLNQTPVSLFISTFRDAMSDKQDYETLDKPLLNELKRFKSSFLSDNEALIVSNEGNVTELELRKEHFEKIRDLEENTPESVPVIMNGIVEELKFSKLKVRIQTDEGMADGFLSDARVSEEIAPYWGKKVTITGIVHYKPGGKSVIEIEKIGKPGDRDDYFSKKPQSLTVEQQLVKYLREGHRNRLSEISGKWPGDETDSEFEKMIKDLD